MDSNNDTTRVTRSLRSRLVSIDAESNSRSTTPVQKLAKVPESETPRSARKPRNSLVPSPDNTTPGIMPSRTGRRSVSRGVTPDPLTPVRRSTRGRSSSTEESEKPKPIMKVSKFEAVLEEETVEITKSSEVKNDVTTDINVSEKENQGENSISNKKSNLKDDKDRKSIRKSILKNDLINDNSLKETKIDSDSKNNEHYNASITVVKDSLTESATTDLKKPQETKTEKTVQKDLTPTDSISLKGTDLKSSTQLTRNEELLAKSIRSTLLKIDNEQKILNELEQTTAQKSSDNDEAKTETSQIITDTLMDWDNIPETSDIPTTPKLETIADNNEESPTEGKNEEVSFSHSNKKDILANEGAQSAIKTPIHKLELSALQREVVAPHQPEFLEHNIELIETTDALLETEITVKSPRQAHLLENNSKSYETKDESPNAQSKLTTQYQLKLIEMEPKLAKTKQAEKKIVSPRPLKFLIESLKSNDSLKSESKIKSPQSKLLKIKAKSPKTKEESSKTQSETQEVENDTKTSENKETSLVAENVNESPRQPQLLDINVETPKNENSLLLHQASKSTSPITKELKKQQNDSELKEDEDSNSLEKHSLIEGAKTNVISKGLKQEEQIVEQPDATPMAKSSLKKTPIKSPKHLKKSEENAKSVSEINSQKIAEEIIQIDESMEPIVVYDSENEYVDDVGNNIIEFSEDEEGTLEQMESPIIDLPEKAKVIDVVVLDKLPVGDLTPDGGKIEIDTAVDSNALPENEPKSNEKSKSVTFSELDDSVIMPKLIYPKTPVQKKRGRPSKMYFSGEESQSEDSFESAVSSGNKIIKEIPNNSVIEEKENSVEPMEVDESLEIENNELMDKKYEQMNEIVANNTPYKLQYSAEIQSSTPLVEINKSQATCSTSTLQLTQKDVSKDTTNNAENLFRKSWSQNLQSSIKSGDKIDCIEAEMVSSPASSFKNEDNEKIASVAQNALNSKSFTSDSDTDDSNSADGVEPRQINEFIDCGAEVIIDYNSGDSLDSQLRREYEENEHIPYGEDINSEDTTDVSEASDYEKDSFVCSDDEASLSNREDISEPEEGEYIERTGKFKKIKPLSSSSSSSTSSSTSFENENDDKSLIDLHLAVSDDNKSETDSDGEANIQENKDTSNKSVINTSAQNKKQKIDIKTKVVEEPQSDKTIDNAGIKDLEEGELGESIEDNNATPEKNEEESKQQQEKHVESTKQQQKQQQELCLQKLDHLNGLFNPLQKSKRQSLLLPIGSDTDKPDLKRRKHKTICLTDLDGNDFNPSQSFVEIISEQREKDRLKAKRQRLSKSACEVNDVMAECTKAVDSNDAEEDLIKVLEAGSNSDEEIEVVDGDKECVNQKHISYIYSDVDTTDDDDDNTSDISLKTTDTKLQSANDPTENTKSESDYLEKLLEFANELKMEQKLYENKQHQNMDKKRKLQKIKSQEMKKRIKPLKRLEKKKLSTINKKNVTNIVKTSNGFFLETRLLPENTKFKSVMTATGKWQVRAISPINPNFRQKPKYPKSMCIEKIKMPAGQDNFQKKYEMWVKSAPDHDSSFGSDSTASQPCKSGLKFQWTPYYPKSE